jgi:acyl transferase domain-containing protein/aryl carrier-like protein
LAALAYTLLWRRDHHPHRLAVVVSSLSQAADLLTHPDAEECHTGTVPAAHRPEPLLQGTFDALVGDATAAVSDRARRTALAHLYVQGYAPSAPPAATLPVPRLDLPGYPFARTVHWADGPTPTSPIPVPATAPHPLLHRNTSTFGRVSFACCIGPDHAYLADHVVSGRSVLPAVVSLELARAGFGLATEAGGAGALRLERVTWSRVIRDEGSGVSVTVDLFPPEDGAVRFEVLQDADEPDHAHVGCDGVIRSIDDVPAPRVDLAAVEARCGNRLSAQACYAAFTGRGVAFGGRMRALTEVLVGGDEILARLASPAPVDPVLVLDPAVVDSALQAAIGFDLATGALDGGPDVRVPFALEALTVFDGSTAPTVAVLRRRTHNEAVTIVDVDLCAADGRVVTRIDGFATRTVAWSAGAQADQELVLATADWTPAPLPPVAATTGERTWAQRVILSVIGGVDWGAAAPSVRLMASDPSLDFVDATADVIDAVREVLSGCSGGRILLQVVVPADDTCRSFGAWHALLRSVRLEAPSVATQLIEVLPGLPLEDLPGIVDAEAPAAHQHVRLAPTGRSVPRLRELPPSDGPGLPVRTGGRYLVTGGAGGLGLIVGRMLASRAEGVHLYLAGRSATADATALDAVRSLGATVHYVALDVCEQDAVASLVARIVDEAGGLDGVVHAAGILDDALLQRSDTDRARAVLAPKVLGVIAIDEATAGLPLEFLVCFSSISGVLGGMGQSAYATANAFLDGFCVQRDQRMRDGDRCGRSLSIAWPLWAGGGMHVDDALVERMTAQSGMRPLPDDAGPDVLDRAWASGESAVVCAYGDSGRIRELLQARDDAPADVAPERSAPRAASSAGSGPGSADAERLRVVTDLLVEELATALGLAADRIDVDERLTAYGIDSLRMMQVTDRLERQFGPLSRTLFFEHRTLGGLAEHLARAHAATLDATLVAGAPDAAAADASAAVAAARAAPLPPAAEAGSARRVPRRLTRSAAAVNAGPRDGGARTTAACWDGGIAVIGMAGRYAGARDLDAFWANLHDGVDCIRPLPRERWTWDHLDPAGSTALPAWGGFLDGVDEFDPQFFRITPRDAVVMEPQERLFLQCAYTTIQDAGYTPAGLAGDGVGARVGVYVGVMYEEYQLLAAEQQLLGDRVAVTNTPASIANRVSYAFDLTGPSMAVDTMCSSSLTAIRLACEAILGGDCDAAIAGGVNVSVHPHKYVMLAERKFASSSGRCESFGANGDGYIPGEGVGAVLLKPLEQAVADGDRILGVIRGTAVNHGGRANGYTVPDPAAQGAVVSAALERAGINPARIGYVETHGTGTALGDPVEIAGLGHAFGKAGDRSPLPIGSVKSNIGHGESAAGIAGMHKVLLQLRHRQLVPSLHSVTPNPLIDFAATPFVVQQDLAEWPATSTTGPDGRTSVEPRVAGLSSFGAGGSNAHVVIEEHLGETASSRIPRPGPHAIVVSARTQEQRRAQLLALADALDGDAALDEIAFTLQTGREAMPHRFGCVVRDVAELAERLRAAAEGAATPDTWVGEATGDAAPPGGDGLAEAVAAWVAGAPVDWGSRHPKDHPRRVGLPAYPFARERYWPRTVDRMAVRAFAGGVDRSAPGDDTLLEMARAAVATGGGAAGAVVISDVEWGLPVEPGEHVHTTVTPGDDGFEWEVFGSVDGEETAHARGRAEALDGALGALDLDGLRLEPARFTGAPDDVTQLGVVPEGDAVLVTLAPGRATPEGMVLRAGDLPAVLEAARQPLGLPSSVVAALARAEFAARGAEVRHVLVGFDAAAGVAALTGCAADGSIVWRLTGAELEEPAIAADDGPVGHSEWEQVG